jgi:hypothetical protein
MTLKLLQLLIVPAMLETAAGTVGQSPKADGPTVFSAMRSLQGTWAAAAGTNRQSSVRFELSANGTVLVEHYTNPALPGAGHMMSAYYLDGGDLLLTHYCIANNQPTLRAERFDAAGREIQFEFVRATNLPSANAGHMHRARYRLLDKDTFVTEWEFFENGVRKMTETETFTRTK